VGDRERELVWIVLSYAYMARRKWIKSMHVLNRVSVCVDACV
jgi:hypothetical protein